MVLLWSFHEYRRKIAIVVSECEAKRVVSSLRTAGQASGHQLGFRTWSLLALSASARRSEWCPAFALLARRPFYSNKRQGSKKWRSAWEASKNTSDRFFAGASWVHNIEQSQQT